MTATIMDGRIVAAEVKKQVSERIRLLEKQGTRPHLSTILVGDDPASTSYLKVKHKACEDVGIQSENHHLPAGTTQQELEALIDQLNSDPGVHGVLIQLPLPKPLHEEGVIERIAPDKDIDGLHPVNAGKLASAMEGLVPCTPKGVMRLLSHYKVTVAGCRAAIINRSNLVGRPLSMLLLNHDATVTICHSKTPNLPQITRTADILVSAVGRPNFQLGAEYVKPGSAVIDIGLTRVEGKLRGDVDFDAVSKVARFITPVPGGVGPMTVAMLLENTVQAAAMQTGLKI